MEETVKEEARHYKQCGICVNFWLYYGTDDDGDITGKDAMCNQGHEEVGEEAFAEKCPDFKESLVRKLLGRIPGRVPGGFMVD